MYHGPAASIPPHSHGTHRPFLSLTHMYPALSSWSSRRPAHPLSRCSPVSPLEICSPSSRYPPPLNSTAHRRKLRGSQPININDISIHRNNVANYGRPYYRGCLSFTLSLSFPSPSLLSLSLARAHLSRHRFSLLCFVNSPGRDR